MTFGSHKGDFRVVLKMLFLLLNSCSNTKKVEELPNTHLEGYPSAWDIVLPPLLGRVGEGLFISSVYLDEPP